MEWHCFPNLFNDLPEVYRDVIAYIDSRDDGYKYPLVCFFNGKKFVGECSFSIDEVIAWQYINLPSQSELDDMYKKFKESVI